MTTDNEAHGAPIATYRFQFNKDFTFERARELLPYLRRLGVSHVYASPILTARAGSMHGYDVVDPTRVNPELGGEEEFAELVDALREQGMNLLLDIVPNHMAASSENAWWVDVLENGPSSRYASFFDVAWRPDVDLPTPQGKIVLPILGDHYGTVLENGELQLGIDRAGLGVHYWETRLPLDPKTYGDVLRLGLERVEGGARGVGWREYRALLGLIERLPERGDTAPEALDWRRRDAEEIKGLLRRLYEERPEIRAFILDNLSTVNGVVGQPRSFDRLDHLLSEQPYRLAYWRVASQEINYRRFFDVADLIALRGGAPQVFEATHRRVLAMAAAGQVAGLRVDHVDGLYDPLGYLRRLQERLAQVDGEQFYVVVEKILTGDERLPDDWPAAGTTGYDFLQDVNGLFVDPEGMPTLDAAYQRVTGLTLPFEEVAWESKRRVMAELFSGDIQTLARQLDHLTAHDRHGRDLTVRELGQALSQVIAAFPVYRSYTRDFDVSERARAEIEAAVAKAEQRTPHNTRAIQFLRRVLTLDTPAGADEEQRREWLRFVMRWQQFTSPIMAKGHEDTALYVYNRLLSANDVGGDPGAPALTPEAFHARNRDRHEDWPATLNATSTHDTKRSEDVRARLNVISELAGAWAAHIDGWRRANERGKSVVNDEIAPDNNEEWFIYQTLAGAWPLDDADLPTFEERLQAYFVKAFREAKVHTSWVRPNADYEAAVARFVAALLTPGDAERPNEFLDAFAAFRAPVAFYGALNALAQTLLKIASPGVPDFYQGTELWDLSLVDPDNRRPVDYARRRDDLDALDAAGDSARLAGQLLEAWPDGRVKLWLTRAALAVRNTQPDLFAQGDYLPLEVEGERAEHVCAFARRHGAAWALIVVPRLAARLALRRHDLPDDALPPREPPLGAAAWGDTRLMLPDGASGCWRNALTGESLAAPLTLAATLATFPVALLTPAE